MRMFLTRIFVAAFFGITNAGGAAANPAPGNPEHLPPYPHITGYVFHPWCYSSTGTNPAYRLRFTTLTRNAWQVPVDELVEPLFRLAGASAHLRNWSPPRSAFVSLSRSRPS